MKKLIILLLLINQPSNAGVSLNQNGLGDMLILPYFTVNNGLNTLVSITNTATDESKALKIRFKDGENGHTVGSFNIYLAPNDSWAFVMVKIEGVNSILSQDASCTPGFDGSMSLSIDNTSLTLDENEFNLFEGHIEIYEMGSLDPTFGFGEAITFTDGEPNDCPQIIQNWEDSGVWSSENPKTEILAPTGGLKATLNLIDVANGINYNIDAAAFNNFSPKGLSLHSDPANLAFPTLADSDLTSLLIYNGEVIETTWPTGFEAISALLMKNQLMVDYSNESSINGQTEVIINFPTKSFYLQGEDRLEPFEGPGGITSTFQDCELFLNQILDRDSEVAFVYPGGVSPRPPFLCGTSSVIKFDGFNSQLRTYLLDAKNTYIQPVFDNKVGFYRIQFNQNTTRGISSNASNIIYEGLPVIAHYITRYTNANAQPGLLAQYGSAYETQNKIKITSNN